VRQVLGRKQALLRITTSKHGATPTWLTDGYRDRSLPKLAISREFQPVPS